MTQLQTLSFLRKILENGRVQTHLLHVDQYSGEPTDLGLRRLLGLQEEYEALLRSFLASARHNTIYRFTDRFFCSYFFIRLPDSSEGLMAGPYTTFPVTRAHLLEKAEVINIPPRILPQMEQFYEQLPVVPDSMQLLNLFTSFGEVIWGSRDAFTVEFADETSIPGADIFLPEVPNDAPLFDMQVMESRYQFENQLMDMVAHGQLHRAETLTESVTAKMFESRVPDPVQNLKYYCIICNTLLRKAAERGGVHPFYLNQMSSAFAMRIDTVHNPSVGAKLLPEMVRSYCRLVQKYAGDSFSPPVRKAVVLIENDLTRDLGLTAVAKELAVSPAYLSSLFKKETGKTFTEFVTARRMECGKYLLENTKLQVQTVAQHCGFADVNYFTKCFKKHFGITPRELRK